MCPSEPAPVLAFRAYPNGKSGLYFWVRIFRTRGEMHAYLRAHKIAAEDNLAGICCGWTKVRRRNGKTIYVSPEMGMICLCMERMGVAVVSHECTHAMFRYIDRKRIDLRKYTQTERENHMASRGEERACLALDELCHQIYDQFYRAGLDTSGQVQPLSELSKT
jgi:hypothetical protein